MAHSKQTSLRVFWKRLGSSLALWTIVLMGLFFPKPAFSQALFLAVISFLSVMAFREYAQISRQAGLPILFWNGLIAGLALIFFEMFNGWKTEIPPNLSQDQSMIDSSNSSNSNSQNSNSDSSDSDSHENSNSNNSSDSSNSDSSNSDSSNSDSSNSDSSNSDSSNSDSNLTFFEDHDLHIIIIPTLLIFCLTIMKLRAKETLPLSSLASTFFGWFYVFWLLMFLVRIYHFPNSWWLLYFIFVVKFSDLGGYVVGAFWGKHSATNISPSKTWEGFFGGLLVSITVSMIFVWLASSRLFPLNLHHSIVLGLMLGVLAIVGDLIESILKREASIKDSGSLFPGIGGSLDLLDSLLMSAPFFYFYCRFILKFE